MEPDLSELADTIDDRGADGYLFDGHDDSDQTYVCGFDAPDPYIALYDGAGAHLLVSGLEYGRAVSESRAESVARLADFDYQERAAEDGPRAARLATIAAFLADHDVESVLVPERFPTGTADGLRDHGIDVSVESEGVITEIRSVKTDEEIEHVRAAQRSNEAAMARAEELIRGATIEDGDLVHDGDVLTGERVKEAIEIELLRQGCALDETIVACGADGADPHDRGSGPLETDEAIVIDIFPRDKESGYHADMTRTFVRGTASDELRARYEITHEAHQAALDAVEAGATGADVHDAVCDVYEDAGYATLRDDPSTETGFIHGTGHGIGLDVHELPRLNPTGGELQAGQIITIEPGLYDPDVGGIRIEDLVVVTEDGHENLTDYPKELEL
ncbi:M24 family metallopeptidase [Natranaeroarchaeum sulfidigenes]|uniref:Xaa-Pro aminopeptidase n=1 Tax=Natranaeroarchaeum sulfidigenes TaxID=2784880 RepID=A0A897MW08_9EURY|nr:Xaa-Pro peptidase family protein [Natranaeroarchaeum sulfidigenes]QSG03273.1 Xaa-Pro aminopeptidase [Natranaeroarchaeum sulfidigenes]